MKKPKIAYLWQDRKRVFGLPLSFTRYRLSEDRLFTSKGFLNVKDDEVLLYRIRDISTSRSLFQQLLHQRVEDMKLRRQIRVSELTNTQGEDHCCCHEDREEMELD